MSIVIIHLCNFADSDVDVSGNYRLDIINHLMPSKCAVYPKHFSDNTFRFERFRSISVLFFKFSFSLLGCAVSTYSF
jgi:hypothetical protein